MRALLLVALLASCTTAGEDPRAQLTASVQRRLDFLGFDGVDARGLSNNQLAALHLELRGRALDPGGFDRLDTRNRVKAILGRF